MRTLIDVHGLRDTGNKIFYGIAGNAVHGLTVITRDGRTVTGGVAREAGPELGVWAVRVPDDAVSVTLVFTDANGKTLQRIRHG